MDAPEPQSTAADQRMVARLRSTGPCTWLLGALILMLIIYPFADKSEGGMLLLGLLNSAVLIASALASSRARRILIIAFTLAVLALVLQWTWIIGRDRDNGLYLLLVLILFYVFTIGHLLVSVLRPGPVTGNKLHGAISAYLMLGLLWAFLYLLIELISPGCFVNLAVKDQGALVWRQFVFFSFTTLTTTGYGDIVPVTGHAQSVTILEQVVGVLYVAILIARLAGLYEIIIPGRRHE